MTASRAGERGLALPTALWLAALVAALGVGAALLATVEARRTAAELERAQARHWAEGVSRLAALKLAEREPAYRAALEDGTALRLEAAGRMAVIRLSRESERLDLNAAEEAEIAELLTAEGVDPERSASVAAAILDYRDPDDLPRLNGAERAAYAAAGRAYGPRNTLFLHPSDLSLVLGVDASIRAILDARATVWATRPEEVAAPGIEQMMEDALTSPDRLEALSAAMVDALARAEDEAGGGGRALRIEVETKGQDGAAARLETVVVISPGRSPPYRILERR